MRAWSATFSVSLALFLTFPACADDSAVSGVGGSVRPMEEHPSIRMVSERVFVTLKPKRAYVTATFILTNTGKSTRVTMGFPERGHNMTPEFEEFHTTVDGQPVPAKVTPWKTDFEESRWRIKTILFKRHQTRVIKVHYCSQPGEVTDGTRFFTYILKTGGSWKGPIGSAAIIVDLSALRDHQTFEFSPNGFVRKDNRVKWYFKNFEPKENISISFHHAYLNFVREGRPVRPYLWYMPDLADMLETEPRIVDGVLMVPAAVIPQLLGGQVRWHKDSHVLVIQRGERRIQVQVPGLRVISKGKKIDLPKPARMIAGRVVVPLAVVAQAVGINIRYKLKDGKIYIGQAVER